MQPADSLQFRRATIEDLPGVFALWDLAGWGPIRLSWFRRRFFEGPEGPAFITIALDPNGEVVATTLTDYKAALLNGEVGRVRRPHALVVAPQWRRRALGLQEHDPSDPTRVMAQWTRAAQTEDGARGEYSLPNPTLHSRPNLSGIISKSLDFKCLRIDFDQIPEESPKLEVSVVRSFHSEYDRLWERAIDGMGFRSAVIRNARSLNHLRGGGTILECRLPHSAELVGYVALGGRSLSDALAVDRDALSECIHSAFMWARGNREQMRSSFVSTLAHPWVDETLRSLSGYEVDYTWRLTVSPVVPGQEPGPEHDPQHWWITAGD